ncbi:DUF5681 domain-containing protein [Methylobacterium longum]|uniref:DUF5681 domain-containing protein n=1 Tax=Methylobacterium longum TaxID=767694 RepID=A0ABT8AWV7_9HYPH|nr:DUF5681 domain-containing protein [Methylobacterium longum]MDN3573920.1 DUF5681 domain-containing protein [Methylobacterium longum]GJE13597.1 hypothetical protein FOHLNKBM_4661 [Methylobacterium longum]
MTNDGYEVGYGKPPRHTRFKQGTSGNPRGRPRRSKDIGTLFDQQLDRLVFVNRDGRKVRVSVRELFAMNIVKAAVNGNSRAQELLLRHMRESGKPDPFGVKPYDDKILAEFAATLVPPDDNVKSED